MVSIKKEHIPNIVTALRFILILPVIYALMTAKYKLGLYTFIVAAVSDALDGFLARHYHWVSEFGAFVDPLADKLVMIVAYLSLAYLDNLPWWLVLLVIGRDIYIMAGVVIYNYYVEPMHFGASLISKINTIFQLLLVVVVLFNKAYSVFSEPSIQTFIQILIYIVTITTIISFLDYSWVWGRKAFEKRRSLS